MGNCHCAGLSGSFYALIRLARLPSLKAAPARPLRLGKGMSYSAPLELLTDASGSVTFGWADDGVYYARFTRCLVGAPG